MAQSRSRTPADQSTTGPLYQPMDHLVVRAPLLPVEAYQALQGRDGPGSAGSGSVGAGSGPSRNGHDGSLDPEIRWALAVASPSLLAALDRAGPGDRGSARLEGKLLRYLIRMSTRPTPFGLFAGVGIARWADRADLALAGPPRTRTRLDMEWLLRLVLQLEADPEVRRHLFLFANTAAFERGDRIHVSERAPAGSSVSGDSASVRATGAVREALVAARHPISYAELAAKLLAAIPNATQERVDQLIAQLCEATLLLTDLRPPLTSPDPAGWVVDRLTAAAFLAEARGSQPIGPLDGGAANGWAMRAGVEAERLAALAAEAAALDLLGPAEAEVRHARLAERMGLGGARSPVQVDARLDLRGAGLHAAVGEAAAVAAELLLRLTPLPDGPPHLAAYRRAFLRRYGPDRVVALLELLDPRFGLGSLGPATGPSRPAGSARRNQLLLDLACRALRDRQAVLELDEELVGQLATWVPGPETAPRSLELYVGVAAASVAAIDEGAFQLVVGHGPGVSPAGRNLGRFADLLAPASRAAAVEANWSAIADGDRAAGVGRPSVVVAELVYLPRRLRQANVVVRAGQHGFELAVGTSAGVPGGRVVPLDELVVGVRDGRLRVWWPVGGAELEVTAGHMLSPAEAPAVCRFLAEVGRDGRAQLGGFSWGAAAGFPFLPRVQVGRVVLRPASWRLDPAVLDATSDSLGRWREEWRVPRHVQLGGGDRRLLLDLDDPAQLGQVRDALGRGRAVTLHEAIPGPGDAWLPGPGGRYLTELVVPLRLAAPQGSHAPGNRQLSHAPAPLVPRDVRLRPPGSEWLYVKLYGPREDEDELLAGPVRELAEAAVEDGLASGWFFVRYGDPDPHLRLRFRGEPGRLTGKLLPRLCEWAGELVAAGRCDRFAIDTYEREVERYGGPEGMAAAEELFVADSRCVAGLVGCLRGGLGLDRVGLAVVTVDDLLDALGLDPRRRLEWFGGRVADRRASGPEHRRRKAVLRPLLADPRRLGSVPGGREVLGLLAERRAALVPIAERLATLAAVGDRLQGGAPAFVHLNCNRLLGPDPAAERLVMGLLLRTRESLDRAPLPRPS
ncbi:MAG TPA: lantibiotic dehydratase [Actinomycetota bacterium]